jgi:glucose dehydrogenase
MMISGSVVFASGTRDKKIRAFDAYTGTQPWRHELPPHGSESITK